VYKVYSYGIGGSYSCVAEDSSLQGCDTVLWVELFPAIQTTVVVLIEKVKQSKTSPRLPDPRWRELTSRSTDLHEKLPVPHPVNKCPVFYGTQKLIIFTTDHQVYLC